MLGDGVAFLQLLVKLLDVDLEGTPRFRTASKTRAALVAEATEDAFLIKGPGSTVAARKVRLKSYQHNFVHKSGKNSPGRGSS